MIREACVVKSMSKAFSICSVRLSVLLMLSVLASPVALADLVSAARSNDASTVLHLIDAGEDVNAPMVDGTTALHWAVYEGNLELVQALIAAGADVNARNDYASSPMSEAGVIADVDIIRALLDAGADVESPTREGQTALMSVVRTPHVDAARLLIEHGADVNATERWRGQTALMFASAQSQPQMVRLLLEHGADPDRVSRIEQWERHVTAEPRPQGRPPGGFTALLLAAREGCAECARVLVEGGASIDQVNPEGITPLTMATLNARWDTAMVLIDLGADVNRWDTWGRAPLYSTVDYNTVPRGGRPDRPSDDAATPVDVATFLLAKGANPNMQLKLFPPYRSLGNDRGGDSMLTIGTTPLIRAAKAGDTVMVKLLLDNGALPNLQNWPGYSPLMAAAGLGSSQLDLRAKFRNQEDAIATAQLLLAAGADVDAGDEQGRRAIHGAATEGWNDFIHLLVEHGADVNARNNNGNSALDVAMGRASGGGRFGALVEPNEETAAVLLELGAEP